MVGYIIPSNVGIIKPMISGDPYALWYMIPSNVGIIKRDYESWQSRFWCMIPLNVGIIKRAQVFVPAVQGWCYQTLRMPVVL